MVVTDTLALRGAVLAVGLILPSRRVRGPVRRRHSNTAPAIALAPAPGASMISRLARRAAIRRSPASRGRILYDFDGNACQGYSLEFRQVSELDTGEGKIIDQRSALDDLGRRRRQELQIHARKFDQPSSGRSVDGSRTRRRPRQRSTSKSRSQRASPRRRRSVPDRADGARDRCRARRARPFSTSRSMMARITGEKVFDTLTVIGHKIAPGERNHDDAAASDRKTCSGAALACHDQLFREGQDRQRRQTPVYSIAFELYENGISRALTLDYNDFVVTGKLSVAGDQRYQAV